MGGMTDLRFEGNLAILELTSDRNEFTHKSLDELNEALDKILANPDAHALVSYSTGKHFTDGIAISEVFAGSLQEAMTFMDKLCTFLVRLLTFPMPTVAGVNGHAYAGGCIFVLAHDYKVMDADRGWLCLPEVNMPQMFPVTLMEIIRCKTPRGVSQRELITMGKRISGPEALRLGLVDLTSPGQDLLQHARDLATSLIKRRPYDRRAMADMKNHVYEKVLSTCGMNNFNFLPPYLLKSSI